MNSHAQPNETSPLLTVIEDKYYEVAIKIDSNTAPQSNKYRYTLGNQYIFNLIANYLAYDPDLFSLRLTSRTMNNFVEATPQGKLARSIVSSELSPFIQWVFYTPHPTLGAIGLSAYFTTVIGSGFGIGGYAGYRIMQNGGDIAAAICGGGFFTVAGVFATSSVTSVGACAIVFLCQKVGLFAHNIIKNSHENVRESLREAPRYKII
ncbi:MAG: hypothetical protein JO149_01630 [Gammaproteobacteria bacterium]|nr:hypothetical protein [Gammaproteobacteria bacterium]